MGLKWHKNSSLDGQKIYRVRIQNSSIIPSSKVYVYIGKTAPDDDDKAHLIVSQQVFTFTVSAGDFLWYASVDGGIFVESHTGVSKLKNYDITAKHETVQVSTEAVSITVPEGSTFAVQNHSDSYASISIGTDSNGSFVLSKNQLLSFSITKDEVVTFLPALDNGLSKISYSITASAVVTQFSKETQNTLDDLIANVDLLNNEMVTSEEVKVYKNISFHNEFSEVGINNLSNVSTLKTVTFKGNEEIYQTVPLSVNDEFTILNEITLNYLDSEGISKQSSGVLLVNAFYQHDGIVSAPIAQSSNLDISQLIDHMNINVSSDSLKVMFELVLKKQVLTAQLSSSFKTRHGFYEVQTDSLSDIEHIGQYSLNLINRGVISSDEIFEYEMFDLLSLYKRSITNQYFTKIATNTNTILIDGENVLEKAFILEENRKIKFQQFPDSTYKIVLKLLENDFQFIDSDKITISYIETSNSFINLTYLVKSISVNKDTDYNINIELDTMNGSYTYFDNIFSSLEEDVNWFEIGVREGVIHE